MGQQIVPTSTISTLEILMSDPTNVTKRAELSASERLDRLEQEKAKVYRTILREALAKHAGFEKMRDAYRKTKRYLSEAEALLTADGFAKANERLESKIADLKEEQIQLVEKRNEATAGINTLRDSIKQHEAVQTALGSKLVAAIESGTGIIASEDEVNKLITLALVSVDADSLSKVFDPFAKFRSTKSD